MNGLGRLAISAIRGGRAIGTELIERVTATGSLVIRKLGVVNSLAIMTPCVSPIPSFHAGLNNPPNASVCVILSLKAFIRGTNRCSGMVGIKS